MRLSLSRSPVALYCAGCIVSRYVRRFGGAQVALACVGTLCTPGVLHGQGYLPETPPERAPVHLGPVALAPTLAVTDVGWDSNVFLRDGEQEGDFTATTLPQVDAWLRAGRARMYARSTIAFVYFKEHPSETSVDQDHQGRLDLVLRHFSPYVSGRWIHARQRFGFEIDARTERHEQIGTAGVELRLSPRTTVDVGARRSRFEFVDTAGFSDPVVSGFYDYTSHGVSLNVRHELTPLTSFGVTVDGHRDRFDDDPLRDSNGVGISGGLEFKPSAAVSGNVSIGWDRVEVSQPGGGAFRGLTASINLAYTLLGATRFTVEAERDLSYSAVRGQHAYLLSGFRVAAQHRLGDTWDVTGRVGHYLLSYGLFDLSSESAPPAGSTAPAPAEDEVVTQYGGELGYRLGPSTRWSFGVDRQHRRSTVYAGRDYERIRAGMSVTYRF